MRIRKQLRVSSSQIAPNSPATDDCQLNCSLWEVISIATLESEYSFQVKEEDEYRCDSVGRQPAYAPNSYVEDDEYDEVGEEERRPCVKKRGNKKSGDVKRKPGYIQCGKIDGKGWRCKSEAKLGEPLCEHHTLQLQSYQSKYKRNRGRVSSTARDKDYDYCAGHGPSRGKKRRKGDVNSDQVKLQDMETVEDELEQASTSSVVQLSDAYCDDLMCDFDSDYDVVDEETSGKKKIRRPVKARSLKSFL